MNTFRTMIVPAAHTPLARALSEGLAGNAGARMFTTELASTDAGPATHYISTGQIQEEFALMMADANLVFAACQAAGSPATLAQVQAMLAASDVSEDEPFAAMTRLGMVMVRGKL